MSPWQLLRANRTSRAALGYHLQHGAAGTAHYSTATAPAPAQTAAGQCDDIGNLSPSSEKQTMQHLNVRLASYLKQVQHLEATNQRLERQIEEELRRRYPGEAKELDGLLQSASFLQQQISHCLSARGQLNLQLLAAELAIADLNTRSEQEREQRSRVEADLKDLRYLQEVLTVHKLPELQEALSEQRQELQELQERHLQDERALLNQVSGGVAVAMQTAESSDLIQQLDMLRQISAAESWMEVPVPMPVQQTPDVTFDLALSSEVAELDHLMRTSTSLTEDLKHLQRENAMLETSGRQQNENFTVQLMVLQETADHLCLDLDSVLQAATQQAADHQVLLDVKSRLEAEIQDYMRLLDSLSHHRASGVPFNSKPAPSCFTVRHGNIATSTSEPVWGANRRSNIVQMISSVADHNMRPKKTAIISRNSSNQFHSFQPSLSRTGWESSSQSTLTRTQSPSPVQSRIGSSEVPKVPTQGLVTHKSIIEPLIADIKMKETSASNGSSEVPKVPTLGFDTCKSTVEPLIVDIKMSETSASTVSKEVPKVPTLGFDTCKSTVEPLIVDIKMSETSASTVSKEVPKVPTLGFDTCKSTVEPLIVDIKMSETSASTVSKEVPKVPTLGFDTCKSTVEPLIVDIKMTETSASTVSKEVPKVPTLGFDTCKSTVEPLIVDIKMTETSASTVSKEVPKVPTLGFDTCKSTVEPLIVDIKMTETSASTVSKEVPKVPTLGFDTCKSTVEPLIVDTKMTSASTISSEVPKVPTQGLVMIESIIEPLIVDIKRKTETSASTVSSEVPKVPTADLVTHKSIIEPLIVDIKRKTETPASIEILPHAANISPTQNTSQESEAPQEAVKVEEKVISGLVKLPETEVRESAILVEVSRELHLLEDKDTRAQDSNDQVEIVNALSSSQGPTLTVVSEKPNVADPVQESSDEVPQRSDVAAGSLNREDQVQNEIESAKVDEEEVSQKCNDVKKIPAEEDGKTVDPSGPAVMINAKESKMSSSTCDSGVDLSPAKGPTLTETHISPVDDQTQMDIKDVERQEKNKEEEEKGSDVFVDRLEQTDDKENQGVGPDDVVEKPLTDSKDVSTDSAESDNELVEPLDQQESKRLPSLSDSGVALSFPSKEALLDPNYPMFCPVVMDENFMGLDLRTSPKDLEMFLSPSDPETCMSPVEVDPIDEEDDEDACLNLTEATALAQVRPVEKYVLSTKDEDEVPRETEKSANTAEEDKFKVLEGRVTTTVIKSPISQESSMKEGSSSRGLESGRSNIQSIIANKEKELGFGGLYRQPATTAGTSPDEFRRKSHIVNRVSVPGERTLTSLTGEVPAGRVRKPSEEWVPYGSSPGQTSESPSGGSPLSTSQPKPGRFGSGEFIVYGGNLRRKSSVDGESASLTQGNAEIISKLGTSAPEIGRFGRRGSNASDEWLVYGGSVGRTSNEGLAKPGRQEHTRAMSPMRQEHQRAMSPMRQEYPRAMSPPETGRFGRRNSGGSDEWLVYGGSVGRTSSEGLSIPRRQEHPRALSPMQQEYPRAMSPPETGRFGRRNSGGSDEWLVYGGSVGRTSNEGLSKPGIIDHRRPMSPPETGRFGRRSSGGSDEWLVYGGRVAQKGIEGLAQPGNIDHRRPMSPPETGRFTRRSGSDWRNDHPTDGVQLPLSPPGSVRFGSGSGEWRVYGGSGRLSGPAGSERVISPPGSYTGRGPRVSSTGGRLPSGGVMKRSSSVGSGGRLSTSVGSQRVSGSVDTKPVYSSAGLRSSSVGTGRPSGGSQRAPSPAGKLSFNIGGWLHNSPAAGNRANSSGSGSKGSTGGSSNDRISGGTGGRVSGSSGSGRVTSTGGRVITSSDRPIRSTGSGSGSQKERISVCKMAALLMSKAGRERSKDKQKKKQQQQQQQATAASPLVQRWLTTGVGVTSADAENPDDIGNL
ncbi:unnamed protein product [Ophioblennius macclurei]